MGAIAVSEQAVIAALGTKKGNVSAAAKILKTSRKTLHAYIADHEDVKDALRDIRESTKDTAEGMLFTRMKKSDTLLIFYLKTQASDRGYRERYEHTGVDGGDIRLVVEYVNDRKRTTPNAP